MNQQSNWSIYVFLIDNQLAFDRSIYELINEQIYLSIDNSFYNNSMHAINAVNTILGDTQSSIDEIFWMTAIFMASIGRKPICCTGQSRVIGS